MPFHPTRPCFEQFLSQLLPTNRTLDFFCDFEKIGQHIDDVRLDLAMLNTLIGAPDLRRAVEAVWRTKPEAFHVLELLIAVRRADHLHILSDEGTLVPLSSYAESVDGVMSFLRSTGLEQVFASQRVRILTDYAFGVETGLDTNARKNRSGHIMEQTVERMLRRAGLRYRREVYAREWKCVQQALGSDAKRFDFVIEAVGTNYLVEVNFYSSGGSKLNEVARSYTELAPRINALQGFEFVWVTDGVGWHSARNKLEEAYAQIPRVYNLTTFPVFLETIAHGS